MGSDTILKATTFEKAFEAGENITAHLDLNKASRLEQKNRRVNVDFPAWVVQKLDKEARRLGVSRQALLKIWIAERIEAS